MDEFIEPAVVFLKICCFTRACHPHLRTYDWPCMWWVEVPPSACEWVDSGWILSLRKRVGGYTILLRVNLAYEQSVNWRSFSLVTKYLIPFARTRLD